jgi:hypothetical protein
MVRRNATTQSTPQAGGDMTNVILAMNAMATARAQQSTTA